jgi:hypothetical protein
MTIRTGQYIVYSGKFLGAPKFVGKIRGFKGNFMFLEGERLPINMASVNIQLYRQ